MPLAQGLMHRAIQFEITEPTKRGGWWGMYGHNDSAYAWFPKIAILPKITTLSAVCGGVNGVIQRVCLIIMTVCAALAAWIVCLALKVCANCSRPTLWLPASVGWAVGVSRHWHEVEWVL